ncbi:MAG: hypothetical protein P8182_07065 [Deltaproteobacteria bacterium]
MTQCSLNRSEASQNWPEGVISVKLTANPYLFALALHEAAKQGLKTWEFINVALWEKLGKPDHDTLMQFAAGLEIVDEDPKWMKRLKITARHELEVAALKKERGSAPDGFQARDPEKPGGNSDNGD